MAGPVKSHGRIQILRRNAYGALPRPVDRLVRIRVGGKDSWYGEGTGGPLALNAPDLFGGEKREGESAVKLT
jgi:hypothetical protein